MNIIIDIIKMKGSVIMQIKELFDYLAEKYEDCEYELFWVCYEASRDNDVNAVYAIIEDWISEYDEFTKGPIALQYMIEERDFVRRVIADALHTDCVLV